MKKPVKKKPTAASQFGFPDLTESWHNPNRMSPAVVSIYRLKPTSQTAAKTQYGHGVLQGIHCLVPWVADGASLISESIHFSYRNARISRHCQKQLQQKEPSTPCVNTWWNGLTCAHCGHKRQRCCNWKHVLQLTGASNGWQMGSVASTSGWTGRNSEPNTSHIKWTSVAGDRY